MSTPATRVWDTPGDTLTFTFNNVTSNPQTTGATNDLEVSRAPDPGDYYTLDDGTFRWKELPDATEAQSGVVELATTDEMNAGAAGVIPDAAKTKAYLDANSTTFTGFSAMQALTATAYEALTTKPASTLFFVTG